MTGPGSALWRDRLTAMHDPAVTAVLAVQCGPGWLRPGWRVLRDEIDEAVTTLSLIHREVRIDRIGAQPAVVRAAPRGFLRIVQVAARSRW